MGQIHYDEVPLEALVRSATHVAIVHPDSPPFREVEEPSTEKGFEGEDVPAFRYRLERLVVEETIHGPPLPDSISVHPANLSQMRDDHRDYFVRGMSSHPIYRDYRPKHRVDDGPRIVFLSSIDGRFAYSVCDAYEGLEALDEVRALLPSPSVPTSGRASSRFITGVRALVGLAFVGIGVTHFTTPDPFVAIVPDVLPAPLALVYVSGAAEVLGGIGLLVPRTRRLAALGLLALLVAVFPANINMAVNEIYLDSMPHEPWLLWARLPFQLVFALVVYWVGLRRA